MICRPSGPSPTFSYFSKDYQDTEAYKIIADSTGAQLTTSILESIDNSAIYASSRIFDTVNNPDSSPQREITEIPDRDHFHEVFYDLKDEKNSILFQTFSGNRPISTHKDISNSIHNSKIVRYFHLSHPMDINFCQFYADKCFNDTEGRLSAHINWQASPENRPLFFSNLTYIKNDDTDGIVISTLPIVRNPDDILSYFNVKRVDREALGWKSSSAVCATAMNSWIEKIETFSDNNDVLDQMNDAKQFFWEDSEKRYLTAVAGAFAKELMSCNQEVESNVTCIALIGSILENSVKFGDVDIIIVAKSVDQDLIDCIHSNAQVVCDRYSISGRLRLSAEFDASPIHLIPDTHGGIDNKVLHVLLETPETVQNWSPILSRSRREYLTSIKGSLIAYNLRSSISFEEVIEATYGIQDCINVLRGEELLASYCQIWCLGGPHAAA